ncbi:hypothetical protein FHS22_000451 [Planomonospora venezuelensis]|uniref:Uncharacterized protein n=1 Tax=Planomonospora venezuelensis TaxID=1999 RepID=A0A841CWL1_PLAVE|nr:hypothetical protein [Planomonospora venezuelensis]
MRERAVEAADRRIWGDDDRFAERNGWRATRASLFVRRYRDPRFDRLALDPDAGREEIPVAAEDGIPAGGGLRLAGGFRG